MALDPQAKAVLDLVAQAGRPGYETMTAPEARRLYRETRALFQEMGPQVAAVADRAIAGPGGPIPLRLYRARGSRHADALPVLAYFHGGGWTFGDLDTHDAICRMLANEARCAVVSVDYRMGPEHKFPAAIEDGWAALRWILAEGTRHGFDARRVAVGGDSAGGNIAAVLALMARDAGEHPAFQLLIYPATDFAADAPSHTLFAEGHLLTREAIRWFTANYLRSSADIADWRASPLRARNVSGVAPALVVTAGFDPLRDEGKAYADRLAAAGVATRYVCYDGMIHGFFGMSKMIDATHRAIAEAGAALAAALGTGR